MRDRPWSHESGPCLGQGGALLARTPWNEHVQTLSWPPDLNYPHILEPGLNSSRPVLFADSLGPRLGLLTCPRHHRRFRGNPRQHSPWSPDEGLAAAIADLATLWVVRERLGRLVVWAYTQNESISAIHPLPQLEEALQQGESLRSLAPLPAVAQRMIVHVALGTRVARLGRDSAIATAELPDHRRRVDRRGTGGTGEHGTARPVVAAAFVRGGAVIFDGADLSEVKRFGEDLADLLLTFTRDTTLVAVGQPRGG